MLYKDILPNGLRIVTETLPDAPSVTTGIFAGVGSTNEEPEIAGVSHFLEHMLFKGTHKRDFKEISEAMESVGGQMNAFTSKEHTCYYAKALPESFELSMDVLSDMYLNSVFDEAEFAKEKGVILEEVSMYEDTPDDLVTDLFAATLWQGHAYGRAIIGTKETVSNLTREQLVAYYHRVYSPGNTVLAVAGNVEHETVLTEARKYFADFKGTTGKTPMTAPVNQNGNSFIYKDIEQMHLCIGTPALAIDDPDIYALNVLCGVLGGGSSSRLFIEAREKRGLTYSIYCYNVAYEKTGYFMAYAGTTPNKLAAVVDVIMEQINDITVNGVTETELERTKMQLKSSVLFGRENSANIMSKIGKSELSLGKILNTEEIVARVMQVTNEDLIRVAKNLFQKDKFVLSLVGKEESSFDLNKYLD